MYKIKKILSGLMVVLLAAIIMQVKNNGISIDNIINTDVTKATNVKGKIIVSYIDVGQGDSILVQQGKESLLIDAGTNEMAAKVTNYIKKRGITKLNYIIGTHPHEDHIGGMDAVIRSFGIGDIYMPKVSINTITYEDVIKAIKLKHMKISKPIPGTKFKLGQASCTILSPIESSPNDYNTYSIVLKVQFGSKSFLFTGDAQDSNERDMIRKGYNLRADVLKVGHHGSDTSTSNEFLNKVNPRYAVISCGKGNSYGHPHESTMEKLKQRNITVYRTDECGTIICTSNGKNIKFNCKPGDYREGER